MTLCRLVRIDCFLIVSRGVSRVVFQKKGDVCFNINIILEMGVKSVNQDKKCICYQPDLSNIHV